LREVDTAHRMLEDFSKCFFNYCDFLYTEHTPQELASPRVYENYLGYENLNDHDRLRNDPLLP
jgi:hypothetical protein